MAANDFSTVRRPAAVPHCLSSVRLESQRSSRTCALRPSSALAPTPCKFRFGPRSLLCCCSSTCNCAPASAGVYPISLPYCASSCSSIANCGSGSISPSNRRPWSRPPPCRFRFPGQATWTAETPTSTREPIPPPQNAAIYFIPTPRFRLIGTAVDRVDESRLERLKQRMAWQRRAKKWQVKGRRARFLGRCCDLGMTPLQLPFFILPAIHCRHVAFPAIPSPQPSFRAQREISLGLSSGRAGAGPPTGDSARGTPGQTPRPHDAISSCCLST